MIPKCLTLTQPWATLVTLNEKRFETRGWNTDYRGPLLVHAAKTFPNWAIKICFREPFRTALVIAGVEDLNDLPLGCIVARSRDRWRRSRSPASQRVRPRDEPD